MRGYNWRDMIAPTLSLFTSAGTLVCCALPAVMVSLGMGAVLAGLASDFPALIILSKHKTEVFGIAAIMITLAGIMMWRARSLPCPIDRKQARMCAGLRKISWWIWFFSILCFATGVFFAFIAPYLLEK